MSWRFLLRPDSSTFVRWLGEDLAGRKVAAASGFLDDIVAFEAEG